MNGVRAKVVERASDPVARFILIEGVRLSGASVEEVTVKKTAEEHWLGKDGWQPMPAHFRTHILEHAGSVLIRLEPDLVRQIPYGCGIEISVESIKLNLKLRWVKAVDLEQYRRSATFDTKNVETFLQREPTKVAETDKRESPIDGGSPLNLSSEARKDIVGHSLDLIGDNLVAPSSSNFGEVGEPPGSEVPQSESKNCLEDDEPKFVPSAHDVAVKTHEAGFLGMVPESDQPYKGTNPSKSSGILIFSLCFAAVAIGAVIYYVLNPSVKIIEHIPTVAENPTPRRVQTVTVRPDGSRFDDRPNAVNTSPPSYTAVPTACNVPPATSRPPTATTFRVDLEIQQARSKLAAGELAEAEAMLRKAVKTGNAKAAVLLGEMQDPLIGTQSNPACAMGWYQYAEFLGIDTSSQRSKLGQWQSLH